MRRRSDLKGGFKFEIIGKVGIVERDRGRCGVCLMLKRSSSDLTSVLMQIEVKSSSLDWMRAEGTLRLKCLRNSNVC